MRKKPLSISSDSGVAMPLRNLISIIAAVAVGVWAYFGIVERINQLEVFSLHCIQIIFTCSNR